MVNGKTNWHIAAPQKTGQVPESPRNYAEPLVLVSWIQNTCFTLKPVVRVCKNLRSRSKTTQVIYTELWCSYMIASHRSAPWCVHSRHSKHHVMLLIPMPLIRGQATIHQRRNSVGDTNEYTRILYNEAWSKSPGVVPFKVVVAWRRKALPRNILPPPTACNLSPQPSDHVFAAVCVYIILQCRRHWMKSGRLLSPVLSSPSSERTRSSLLVLSCCSWVRGYHRAWILVEVLTIEQLSA